MAEVKQEIQVIKTWHRAPGVISPAEIRFGLGHASPGEDTDELMAPQIISSCKTSMTSQIISACETANYSHLQFGSFFFGEMPNCSKVLASAANMSTLIFKGANWRTKQCKLWRLDFGGVILRRHAARETVDGVSIRFFILKITFRFLLDLHGVRDQAATAWVRNLKLSEFLIF